MSLDVYLTMLGETHKMEARIFVRDDGYTKELTRQEWDERFPGQEPVVMRETSTDEVYSANVTHNLNKMAGEAGIYEACWRPEEIGITKAKQLIESLRAGLEKLKADPKKYEAFDPPNGWGSYKNFVPWVAAYLSACEDYPDA